MKPSSREGTPFYAYLQPFPQEAERLIFTLDEMSAVREDGTAIPLSLSLSRLGALETRRQRLLASGDLPPGHYTGIFIRVKEAHLRRAEDDAALLVPGDAVRLDLAFDIKAGQASLLFLAFNYEKSVQEGSRFFPAFSLFVPERPVVGVVGYVANAGADTLTIFDKQRKEAVGAIATGRGPRGMALDPRSKRGFVALADDDAVEVIDVAAGNIVNRLRLIPGDHPQEPALTPDGSLLLTANAGSDTVSVIDAVSLVEVNRVAVGNGPNAIVIDPAGRRAYTFNTHAGSISVIDLATRSLVTTLAIGPEPLRGQFNKTGDRLYVIHKGSPYLTVIDPFSLATVERVFAGMGMTAVKFDVRTNLLYLAKRQDARVDLYDPFSLFPIESIDSGGSVASMAIDGDEENLYLVLPERKSVMIFNLVSKKAVSEIDVGDDPYWVTLMGER